MYKIGDLLVYENHGVCKVAEIKEPEFMKPDKRKLCYVLEQVFKKGTIYSPVDNEKVTLRPVMTKKEALEAIDKIEDKDIESYSAKKSIELEAQYKEAMSTHDCEDLIQLSRAIYKRKKTAQDNNKKVSQVDERFLRDVDELIEQELSVALDIEKDKVAEYIEDRIANARKDKQV